MPKQRKITLQQLAAETGKSVRALQYIRAQEPGVLRFVETKTGTRYLQPDCAINLRRREEEKSKKRLEEGAGAGAAARKPIRDAELRKANADAEMAEIKVARERGTLVLKADSEHERRSMGLRIRAQILGLAGQYAQRLIGLDTVLEARKVLRQISLEVLDSLEQDPPPPDLAEDLTEEDVVAPKPVRKRA